MLLLMIVTTYIKLPQNTVYGAISYSGQTETGEYGISTTAQLDLLATKVNSGTSYSGSTFILTNNITYDSSVVNNYTPIGSIGSPFKGKFDGKGYSIGGININNPYASNVGVFGCIDNSYIVNLNLINSTITALNNVGGIVGNVQNSVIEKCTVNSLISGSNTWTRDTTGIIGGVAGYGYNTRINECINNGKIYGLNIGGIIGELKGLDDNNGIFNSINNGYIDQWSSTLDDITKRSGGGIVGRANNIEIRSCTNTGNIAIGTGDKGSNGGISGVANNVNIYFCNNKSSSLSSGGITGYINNSLIYGCINSSLVNSYSNMGGAAYAAGITSLAYNSEVIYSASRIVNIASFGSYGGDKELVAAGIVGKGSNVKINYSYSMSNIKETVFHDNSAGRFSHTSYIGGIVGLSSGNVNINNSYTAGLVKKAEWRHSNFFVFAYPVGGTNVNTSNTHYLENNTAEQEYTNIGQKQNESYMKSQEFVNLLNSSSGGTSEKDVKNPFVKTSQNNGYPIFWYEQIIESISISGAAEVIKDDTIVLSVSTVPENISGKEISWTTSDSSIADIITVGNGKSVIIRGVRKGAVTITARAMDGSNKVATKTINVISNFAPGKANYILVDEKIEYKKAWKDTENDPLFKAEYRYVHTPELFKDGVKVDNSMGYVSYNNVWISNEYAQFSKVGTYKIQYRVQDNPPTANKTGFESYRYYSSIAESTIYVHRKPIAVYTINASNIITESSYDLDHSVSRADKGIAKWEWTCISNSGVVNEYTATVKATGVSNVQSWINTYKALGYKIILRVQDIEGAWSEPVIKSVAEISKPIADFAIEKNPLTYPESQTITDLSYDTNGLAITYQWNVYKSGANVLSSSSNNITSALNSMIPTLFPNVTGTYTISLKVVNSAGVESDTVTKTFNVVVYNQAPTADFDLVSNESPAWSFPKVLGLHTLRYRPTSSFFHEEKTRFNLNITDPNTDNTGFVYDWKLERFAVKDIGSISGAATSTYSYTTQIPFTNSFKGQGLPWGAYRIILSVTDKPPIPPYASGDAKTTTVTKTYYIVPELNISGSFESSKAEIIVGDTIKAKAKTNKMTEAVTCALDGSTYTLNKISEDSNFAYWEKNIPIPDSITESGTYQMQFIGSTTYGGNGNVTREIRDTVSLDIIALKLINFRITDIVNHPHVSFPQTKDMLQNELIKYKAGYYVTFRIDSKGKPDTVTGRIDIGNNGSVDQIINLTKVASGDTETWQGRFYTSAYLPAGTVISIKLDCSKGSNKYDYNLKESWDGRSLVTNGSALMDGRINLTN